MSAQPITPIETGSVDDGRPAEGIRVLYAGAALVVCLIGVYFIRDVVAPVFLAMTLVATVRPLVLWLNDHRVPKMVSALIGMVVVFLVLAAILLAVTVAMIQFIEAVPAYADRFNQLYTQLGERLLAWGVSQETISEWLSTFDFTRLFGWVTGVFSGIGFWASFLGSLFLFVAFIAVDLTDTTKQRSKLQQVRPFMATSVLDFSWRVRRYWIVNTIFGVCVAIIDMGILAWLQIPLVLTWGILAFVTAYIPNVGFIIGMVPPALMALLARDTQTMLVMVAAYLVVNFIASMVIQPKVTGDAVGLNITTTFISLVFWSIIIGPMGAILAVPLTLFVKSILFDAYPRTRWVSIFLGGSLDEIGVEYPLPIPPVEEVQEQAALAVAEAGGDAVTDAEAAEDAEDTSGVPPEAETEPDAPRT